jgi:hypothetical protein
MADGGGSIKFTELGFVRKAQLHKTVKYQVVEDWRLAVILRSIQGVVLVYAFRMMTYYHQYNAAATPIAVMTLWADTACTSDGSTCTYTGSDEGFCGGDGKWDDFICAEGWEYLVCAALNI